MTRILLAWVFFTSHVLMAAPSSTRELTGARVKNGSGQLNINSSGTMTLPNATDTVVGRNTTDTLTNKTLTSPVINTPTGITKSDVGLGNVDNTSDATKNSAAVTLTNKTIDGDNNTVQDLPITSLKTNLTDASKFLVRDASGVPTSATKAVPTGDVVGTSDTQTLSSKTLSDSLTFAEISTPSTPSSGFGRIYFKSDGKLYQLNDDGSESAVGSGAGSTSFNYIENPGWESNALDWTASGGSYSRTTTAANVGTGVGAGSWDSNASSQTLTSDAVTLFAGAYGRNGVVSCAIQTPSGTATHLLQAWDGTNVLASQTITSTTNFSRVNVNFIFPSSGSIRARLVSVASNEPAINIDDCYLGLAEGFNVSQVSQASFYGALNSAPVTNCAWTRTGAGSDSFANFSADTDCSTPTVAGFASAPATKIPGITFTTLPPGEYQVVVSMTGFKSGGVDNSIGFRISDGTSTTSAQESYPNTNQLSAPFTLMGRFSYTTAQSNITFQVQGVTGSTSNSVVIPNDAAGKGFTINVYRFPTSSETAIASNVNAQGGTAVYPNGSGKLFVGTSASWATITDADFPTGRTFQGGAIAPSTSNDLGVQSAGVLPAGRYMVLFSGALYNQYATSATTCEFAISDGTTRGPVTDTYTGATGEVNYLSTLVATFEYSSAAQRNFVIQYKRGTGGGNCGADIADARELSASMTIIPLSNQIPAPILVGSVTSNSASAERVERATVAGGSPPVISSQSGTWLSTPSRNGAGDYTFTIVSGIFSGTPTCNVTHQRDLANTTHQPTAWIRSVSSSSIRIAGGLGTSGNTLASDDASAFHITCIGPR